VGTDREAAARLVNTRLHIARRPAPLPPAGGKTSSTRRRPVGLAAVSPDGAELGRIDAVHDYGAGSAWRSSAHRAVHPAAVPAVDIAAGRVTVQPPAETLGGELAVTLGRATVLTLFPEMFPGPLGQSLAGRGLERGAGRWPHRTSAPTPPTATATWTTRPSAAARGW